MAQSVALGLVNFKSNALDKNYLGARERARRDGTSEREAEQGEDLVGFAGRG